LKENVLPEKTVSDEELARLFQKSGNSQHFAELVKRHAPCIRRYLQASLIEESELDDLVQEIFIGIYHSLEGFRFKSSVKTWIYSITFRQMKKLRRTKARINRYELGRRPGMDTDELINSIADTGQDTGELMSQKEDQAAVMTAIHSLPGRQKEVIIMRYMQGLKIREIAVILNRSPGTIKSSIFKALSNLKQELQEAVQ